MIHSIGSPEQNAKLTDLLHRFACADDDFRTISAWELPEGYVCVIIGEKKGRPLTFGIDQQGVASS